MGQVIGRLREGEAPLSYKINPEPLLSFRYQVPSQSG